MVEQKTEVVDGVPMTGGEAIEAIVAANEKVAESKIEVVQMLVAAREKLAALTVANTNPLRHLDRCLGKIKKAVEDDLPW